MNNFYVYAYLHEDGTPYYIGKGKGRRAYLNGRIPPKPLHDERIKIIKDNLEESEAFDLEKLLISQYGRKDLGTGILQNRTEGGEGVSGRIATPEAIQKRVLKNTGKKRTDEQKVRMSLAQINRKEKTEEEKLQYSIKMSNAKKGVSLGPKTDFHKENLSKSLLGKYKGVAKSEETKQKMRKPKSEAHRKAISEGRKAKFAAKRLLKSI
jgi:hypothetical protein